MIPGRFYYFSNDPGTINVSFITLEIISGHKDTADRAVNDPSKREQYYSSFKIQQINKLFVLYSSACAKEI